MFKIGDKLTEENYTEGAIWCNENNATIKTIDGEYVIVEIPAPTEEELKQSRIAELELYLTSTDWYAIRESETGVDIPADIKQARADARTEISTLRGDK